MQHTVPVVVDAEAAVAADVVIQAVEMEVAVTKAPLEDVEAVADAIKEVEN